MNKYLLAGGGIVVAFLAGILGGHIGSSQPSSRAQTGGDFAGGIVPSQLFSASSANNSVTPILSNLYVNGGISAGGTAAGNQIQIIAVATGSVSSVVLGAISASTSTVTSTVGIPFAGLSVGDGCAANLNVTTTNSFGADCSVTAAANSNATATVTVWNGSSATYTLPTSTVHVQVTHYAF